MTNLLTKLPREQWVSALSAVPEIELAELVKSFSAQWQVKPLALPQAGLGMLKLKDGALGESFYMGEFPVATCRLVIITEDDQTAEGAALIMDDRVERAEQMAMCDAVLSAQLPGREKVARLIDKGIKLQQKLALERKSLLAKTRVDFSLLEDAGYTGEDQ